jgi:peptidoglycan hydrolase-like protein with peptidoglycan-binding domain
MTPFRMRLLVVAFLAIATAITVNALYFQEGPRFAVTAKDSGANKVKARIVAQTAQQARSGVTASLPAPRPAPPVAEPPAAPSPAQTEIPRTQPATNPAAPQPTPLVRSIQKKLAQFGHKAMPQDGLLSPETRAAILAVEFEQGRPLSGEPAEPILNTLYFLEASGRNRLASTERFERDQALVQEVQDFLAKLGYTSGPVDGQLDAKTREAIKKFEADRRLKAAGRLTERVLLEMVLERGKPFLSKG